MNDEPENRRRILMAANAIFAADGLAGLSVRAIAARAGLSTIGVYSHFNGKAGILGALFVEGFDKLGAAADIPETEAGTDALIDLLVDRYLDFARDHHAHYELMFGFDRTRLDIHTEHGSAAKASIDKLASTIRRLLPPDESPDVAQTLAYRFWVLMHGYVVLKQRPPFNMMADMDWRNEVKAGVTLLVEGMAKHAKPCCGAS